MDRLPQHTVRLRLGVPTEPPSPDKTTLSPKTSPSRRSPSPEKSPSKSPSLSSSTRELSGREFWDMRPSQLLSPTIHTTMVTVTNTRQARAVVYKTGRIPGAVMDYSDMVVGPENAPTNITALFDIQTDDAGIFWRRLNSLALRPEKVDSAVSTSAGLYLWLAAHGADIPLHKPIQLQDEETGVIAEGSSTYKCLCAHFDEATLVPCTVSDTTYSSPEERLLFAAWKGQTDRVRLLLQAGASPYHMFPRYSCTALSKSEELGYRDVSTLLSAPNPRAPPSVNDCGCGFNFMFSTVQGLGLAGSQHGHHAGACGSGASRELI